MAEEECNSCKAPRGEVSLYKCPICFKLTCETCRINRSGRDFCSAYCADYFFFGEEE